MSLSAKIKNLTGGAINNIIGLFGIILIFVSSLINKNNIFYEVIGGVGVALLAAAVASLIKSRYMVKQSNMHDMINTWGLVRIEGRRQQINDKSAELLKHTQHLDIMAYGLKSFRDAQPPRSIISKCKRGLTIRILTLSPDSDLTYRVDTQEHEPEGYTKSSITDMSHWVDEIKKQVGGKIQLRYYDEIPPIFYFAMDDGFFVGPHMNKSSQQTITYEYLGRGQGQVLYSEYFNSMWDKAK